MDKAKKEQLRNFLNALIVLCDKYGVSWTGSIRGQIGTESFDGPFVGDKATATLRKDSRGNLLLNKCIEVQSKRRGTTLKQIEQLAKKQEEEKFESGFLPRRPSRKCLGTFHEVMIYLAGDEIMCHVSIANKRVCFSAYTDVHANIVRYPSEGDPKFKWRRTANSLYVEATDPQKLFRFAKQEGVLTGGDEKWINGGLSWEEAYKDEEDEA